MLCCGVPLSATGGHGDLNGMSPNLHIDTVASDIADGPEAIRKTVRNNVKYGADWIKILASAGVLSEEESVGRPQYTEEEMKDRPWTRPHSGAARSPRTAHGPEAIKMAVRAGVYSIEHCSLVDDEGIALMKQKGAWLVPTIYCVDYVEAGVRQAGLSAAHPRQGRAGRQAAHRDLPQGRAGGCPYRLRHRRGRVPARPERAGVSLHGRARHDADAGHPGRHDGRGGDDRLEGTRSASLPRATSRT